MSKIKNLISDNNSIIAFDVDGVLAKLEWGEYTHFVGNEDEWDKLCEENINTYTKEKVSSTMQNFLKNKDKTKIYVITCSHTENEKKFKKEYLKKYYNILEDNVYFVEKNSQKKGKLMEIKKKHSSIDDHHIIMVEDTVEILDDIMNNTNFTTVHISTFLDM